MEALSERNDDFPTHGERTKSGLLSRDYRFSGTSARLRGTDIVTL